MALLQIKMEHLIARLQIMVSVGIDNTESKTSMGAISPYEDPLASADLE
jgi:hypothetical protein